MRTRWFVAALAALLTSACGSVEVPRERFFRLDLPEARRPDPGRAGVLRVEDLRLGTALDGDCLLVQHGVEVEPRPLDRWIAPLDRLVTEALLLGLSRARVCDLVKGAGDAGTENWTLHGRIVEFGEVHGSGSAEARIALELWLEQDGRLLFHDEFRVAEPVGPGGPEAAVAGLSAGLSRIVDGVVERMQAQGLFAAARPVDVPAAPN